MGLDGGVMQTCALLVLLIPLLLAPAVPAAGPNSESNGGGIFSTPGNRGNNAPDTTLANVDTTFVKPALTRS